MHVPQWLALTIAAAVILFGIFRIYLATGGLPDEERAKRRRGMYAMSRRQHGLIGVLFIIVGSALIATALGWNPMQPAQQGKAPAEPARRGGGAIVLDPLTEGARLQIQPKNRAPTQPAPAAPPTQPPAPAAPPATP